MDDGLFLAKLMWIEFGNAKNFSLRVDAELCFMERLYVHEGDNLRQEILKVAHQGHFSHHLGSIKMYRDLKSLYWWSGMKREISEFVAKCLTCQIVKKEHQVPSGKLFLLEIPK
ncbi:NBS-LRR resistance-like protein [Gossypium australe]|uniref:NBS-LRR resistance-like protein n=1 Tax=Gossypium australe TaxID=47621 RepID=A0A5B6VM86_9ROSI|nr:NBS-LRR resistance-like protein [Gossypium australe]